MTTNTMSSGSHLQERRARLAALQAQLDQVNGAVAHHTGALGRAVAGDVPESDQKRIRIALADARAQRDGIASALPLVEAEIASLEQEAKAEELERLRTEADQLRETYEVEYDRTAQDLNAAAARWLQRGDALAKLHSSALQARRAVLRAQGADKEDVNHAIVSIDRAGPSPAGIASDTAFWRTLRTLIRWSDPR